MKQFMKSLVVLCLAATANAGVTTHLKLDCRTGVRAPSSDGEVLRYDASWYENGDSVRITDNGTVVATGAAGTYAWRPTSDSSSFQYSFKLEALSAEGEVVGTETAQFALGYIRNVTARQLWPHNKVALSFTVADDIGEVKRENEDLCVWFCAQGWATNVAKRILGDRSAKPGVHRIVWDLESDGLRFTNTVTPFGVSVEEVSLGGVQLWENGPYWAECNVGASKPEEYGYYFWWGDTVGYKRNASNDGWVSVKDGTSYSFSGCPTYGKSNSQLQSEGYTDSTGNLIAAHDAATAHFGAPWRLPTDAEFSALIKNCDTQWATRGGVYGRLVTGRGAYASKSIFLPDAGYGNGSRLDTSPLGYSWSSTPNSANSDSACHLNFDSSDFEYCFGRSVGLSVRPLRGFAK